MFCNNCGNQIADGNKFCEYCGNKIEINYPEMQPHNTAYTNNQMKNAKSGMSTGAIIGLVCGIVAALTCVILVICIILKSTKDDNKQDEKADITTSSELTTEEITTVATITETTTETTTEITAPVGPSEEEKLNAKKEYINILNEHKSAIRSYNWQMGYGSSDSYPVSVIDLNSDGLDELIFMEAKDMASANLLIYSLKDNKAEEVYKQEDLDVEVAGGTVYYVSKIKDENKLFIYHSVSDEGYDEWFEEVTIDDSGKYNISKKAECSSYPNDDYTENIVTNKIDDIEVSNDEFSNYINEMQGKIDTFLMYSEGEDISNLVSSSKAINVSLDDAVKNLGEGIDIDTDSMFKGSLPVDKNIEFNFASGAGGWGTVLMMDEDGNFEGSYHDSDMGDIGEGYQYGSVYLSNFTGKFKNITQIDDYTFKMELDYYETEKPVDTEEIIDEVRYIYSEPYGIEGGNTFYLYLPGKPVSELSEDFISWSYGIIGDISGDDKLKSYGLYNEAQGEGFYVWAE